MTAAVRISVLGPPRVWRDGVAQPVGSPQQQATLVALVMREGRSASVDELAAAVWGDDLPDTAAATLRTYIYRLRRLFAGSVVTIHHLGGGYVLRADQAQVDVTDFHAWVGSAHERARTGDAHSAVVLLRAALELWGGEALAGVPGRAAEAHRARLAETRLTAEELLFTARLRTGEPGAEETARLTELVEAYPLREGFRVLLMQVLYRRGRQAEALELYRRGRELLREELALDPGPALREMQQRILCADPDLLLAGSGPGPTYLPADLPDFTGRDAELAVITEALAGPGATVGVTGMPGFGRSSTVVHAAHLMAAHFPDGRLYADLGLADGPADALLTWLRLFGAPAGELPASATGRAALLRTLAGRQRPLIVLDDVADPSAVALVRSALPHAAVLFTSRRRHPELPGTTWVTLGGLPEDDAMRLFERVAGPVRVGADREAVRWMITAVHGGPLSMRLGGERAVRRPHRTLRALAEELGAELHDPFAQLHDDCVIVEGPVERAYAMLRPQQARTLRFLTAMPDCAATVAQTAALVGTGENTALTALESLVDLHLLVDEPGGRYRIADPIAQSAARRKLYAIEGPAEAEAARRRACNPVAGEIIPGRIRV